MQLVECVPNFSEGRRADVIAAIVAAVGDGRDGVRLLDVSSDADHNRTVVTFAGPPAAAGEAALRTMAVAQEAIDMGRHRGAHPRLGATDVVPFVPLKGVTMADCVTLAREVARRAGETLDIPVYLYAAAALRPERVRLPAVRRGEYEGWRRAVGQDPARAPDFGPAADRPWGATAIGARDLLVAYNLFLTTADVDVAVAIARRIRESSGGMPGVQARGFLVGGRAQVSINLLDHARTPLHNVVAAVGREAAARGVGIARGELIGLLPQAVLDGAGWAGLALDGLGAGQILERRLADAALLPDGIDAYLEATAAGDHVPGSGSAAALAGALAAALGQLLGRVSSRRAADPLLVESLLGRLGVLREELQLAMAADARAYDDFVAVLRDQARPPEAREEALRQAALVPLGVARRCAEVVDLVAELVGVGSRYAVADGAGAALLAEAALRAAGVNVRANAAGLQDPAPAADWLAALTALEDGAAARVAEILATAARRGGYR